MVLKEEEEEEEIAARIYNRKSIRKSVECLVVHSSQGLDLFGVEMGGEKDTETRRKKHTISSSIGY